MTSTLLLCGYAVTLAVALHLLTAARRDANRLTMRTKPDAASAPAPAPLAAVPPPVARCDGPPELERLAADVHETLGVDRVAVVVTGEEGPGMGRVGACVGPDSLLGSRVSLIPEPVSGPMTPTGAAALGIGGPDEGEGAWSFAHVPITTEDELLGAITVACEGDRRFTDADLARLERLARSQVPRFDRRKRVTIPRAVG
jgi:hypothetical protein